MRVLKKMRNYFIIENLLRTQSSRENNLYSSRDITAKPFKLTLFLIYQLKKKKIVQIEISVTGF
jgi:hypothetical protein